MTTTIAASQRSDAAIFGNLPATLDWMGDFDGELLLLDQTILPNEVAHLRCNDVETVWEAIKVLRVRGAPAIGVAAAYGVFLGIRGDWRLEAEQFVLKLEKVAQYLSDARPTAVNLAWAVRGVRSAALAARDGGSRAMAEAALAAAREIHREDIEMCRRIGEVGAHLVPDGGGVLTHCNAGALATSAYGTALSPLYVAHRSGRRFRVFASETRPLLQGARLTAFELASAGIDVTVICDGAVASLMHAGEIQMAIVGADRIAANGDTANKIGTYSHALAAKHHEVPFYVAAPHSTFDLSLGSASEIPIEQRSETEVRELGGRRWITSLARCRNPAFDVTPAGLIRGIVTDRGLSEPVTIEKIQEILSNGAWRGPG
ncbi:MAG: S-methyl-5-thioribose-1-phosphate isomerase [Phycisphaerales bacterium]|nr:S-methyl-5-thioribose-1-phosphate isomerase [Phycisphaerales bacterium]